MTIAGLVVLVFLVLIKDAECGCFNSRIVLRRTGDGLWYHACEYRGVTYRVSDDVIETDNCYSCHCSHSGWHCCGIGINAGPRSFPDNCKEVIRGCNFQFVSREDESRECATGEQIVW